MKASHFVALLLAAAIMLSMTACGAGSASASEPAVAASSNAETPAAEASIPQPEEPAEVSTEEPLAASAEEPTEVSEEEPEIVYEEEDETGYPMDLDAYADSWVYDASMDCYALYNVFYCRRPVSETLQNMNIFVPAAYMNDDGTINPDGTINGYTAETAPIVYGNGIAGYMEAAAGTPNAELLAAGMVYVSVGARGRGSMDENGTYIGKSPLGLVDLKAGVRFLKRNQSVLVGDSDKIISMGSSAGGAMSALLGTTGNSHNYDDYLRDIGACMNETDNVFASQCYCPITDLEHADMAYEWYFLEDDDYIGFLMPGGTNDPFQQALSEILAEKYVDYYNSLNLVDFEGQPLKLDGLRSGSGYDFLIAQLEASLTNHLTKIENGELDVDYTAEDYINGNYTYFDMDFATFSMVEYPGHDLSGFVTWDGEKATITDLDAYVTQYNRRLKACLAFDDLSLAQAENEEMGNETTNAVHFDLAIAEALEALKDSFPEEYATYADAYGAVAGDAQIAEKCYLINPMNYLGTEEKATTADHFRIRVGGYDPHTATVVSMNLALKIAETTDADVDYAVVWDQPHGEADYAGELQAWIESITK